MAVTTQANASTRRFVFGLNALVQSLLVLALVVGVIWIAARFNVAGDWTRTGVNSVSQRTRNLLQNVDQHVRITALFVEPDEERDKLSAKRYRELSDLLDLYDRIGGAQITTDIIDPSLQERRSKEVLARLKALPKYKGEAAPHEQALEQLRPVMQQILDLVTQESAQLEQLAQTSPALQKSREFATVRTNLRFMMQDIERVPQELETLKQRDIPPYGEAVKSLRQYLTDAQTTLRSLMTWMTTEGVNLAGLSPETRSYFEQAASRYQPVLDEMAALLEKTEGLQDVELETVERELRGWSEGPPVMPVVLVESEQEAKVLAFWDLWAQPPDMNAPLGPEGEMRQFAGEAALSSAILQLTQEEKTAVVFTRYGGESPITPDFSNVNINNMRELPTAPYIRLNDLLEKQNFITHDWDVKTQKEPPAIEDAGRVIYVVFPPEPPPRQNPMQPSMEAGFSDADRQIVLDAVGRSGMAIFLAGWMQPASMMPGDERAYEFEQYLRETWGLELKTDYLTIKFTPSPDKPGLWVPVRGNPLLLTTEDISFTDHPISKPIEALTAAFDGVCPLFLVEGEGQPEGVEHAIIAEVGATEDVWAIDNIQRVQEELNRNMGLRPTPSDIKPPFAIAASATKNGQRVVVFASTEFARDQIAQSESLMLTGGGLVRYQNFPANTDLFLNSLHWLTGEADRIAVGPRQGDVPRLNDLNATWAAIVPWILVGIWPALALLAGVGVWFVRRR